MRKCSKCNTDNPDDANYCRHCGSLLPGGVENREKLLCCRLREMEEERHFLLYKIQDLEHQLKESDRLRNVLEQEKDDILCENCVLKTKLSKMYHHIEEQQYIIKSIKKYKKGLYEQLYKMYEQLNITIREVDKIL